MDYHLLTYFKELTSFVLYELIAPSTLKEYA